MCRATYSSFDTTAELYKTFSSCAREVAFAWEHNLGQHNRDYPSRVLVRQTAVFSLSEQ